MLDKSKLLAWIEDLKINGESENIIWYDQALQDVMDAIGRGDFDVERSEKPEC